MPLVLLGLGVQCIRRKTIDLALNPMFCWLYSLVIFLFAFAFSGFSSMLFAALFTYP